MDIQSAVIGVGVFIVSGSILLFIYIFGMKEKSYEEAITEQRQQAKALLGSHTRPKPKEKKAKKLNKKEKMKKAAEVSEPEVLEESEDAETRSSSAGSEKASPKPHVEFKEPTVIDTNADIKVVNKKKRKKKEKVRPILIHKPVENPVAVDVIDVPTVNNFEQLHPKDDLELLHAHLQVKEESAPKVEKKEEKVSKPKQNGSTQEPKEKVKKVPQNNAIESKENKEKTGKPAVEVSLKTKPEVTQPIPEKQEPVVAASQVVLQTNGIVQNKEKKKKKGEVNPFQQIVGPKDGEVDLPVLLNVVRNAELSRSEVQILIDLLLNKQHEAPVKLDEWSEGKSDPIQKLKKQLAEKEKALAEEQETFLALQNKLREIRAEQISEKSLLQQRVRSFEEALQAKQLEIQSINGRWHNTNQKMQQMQAQLNEEGLTIRQLREENAALQLQRQQLDMHLAQTQERDAKIQDLHTHNNQLTLELRSLNEQNLASKEHNQGLLVQLQQQVNHFKTEIDDKDNYIRQLEEIRHELEHRLTLVHRQENDLNAEVSRLNSVCQKTSDEMRRLEIGNNQVYEEIQNLQKQKEEFQQTITQLKSELVDAQTEKSELQMLKANGLAKEDQSHKEELLNLQNELSSVKSELQHEKIKYTAELNASKTSLNQLEQDLNEQKNKNNELRKKNWKVMDALRAAESRNNLGSSKTMPVNLDDMIVQARLEERDSNKKFIERLFPEIRITNGSPYDQWVVDMGKAIENYVQDLEKTKLDDSKSESDKLQAQVHHYKSVIDKTEGILKTLQNRIEEEEIHWQRELRAKEVEIENLKLNHLSEVQTKIAQIQLKLTEALEEKQRLYEQLQNRSTDDVDRQDDGAQNETNSLDKKVLLTNLDTNDVCLKEQNSNATNGSSVLVQ